MASKQILNDIQKLIHWSQLTNLFSIPTDCDQRNERQGWMGDAQATAEEAMMNFDMAAFYTNFIRDIRDAQGPDGALPSTVPRKYGEFPGRPGLGDGLSADLLVYVGTVRRSPHPGTKRSRLKKICGVSPQPAPPTMYSAATWATRATGWRPSTRPMITLRISGTTTT